MSPESTRRAVLTGIATLPLIPTVPAAAAPPRPLLIQGAEHVVTMAGPALHKADILVRDGGIAAIGPAIDAPEAEKIDARGHVILPGFVDTHWHMWNTAARSLWRSSKGGFAPTMAAWSRHVSPADAATGVELSLAEAINAGITTVHNWAHNIRSPAQADAEIAAMVSSGVRGRFAYGYAQDAARSAVMDMEHLMVVARTAPSDLISIGICARGPDRSDKTVWQAEWDGARKLGLPISTHMTSDPNAAALGGIAALAARDGLGPDVQLVHLTAASRADMDRVAQAGSPVSISPWTELEVGYGIPPIADMIAAKLLIGLSVDNVVLAGSADMTSVMRLAVDLARGAAHDQLIVTDETALRWATVDAARSLGMNAVGTLAPGMRADLIGVRMDAINMAPANDLPALLTHAARPDNISLVMIDGVPHKRDGQLLRVDLTMLQDRATRSIRALRDKAGL